jgi:hypothetical protein
MKQKFGTQRPAIGERVNVSGLGYGHVLNFRLATPGGRVAVVALEGSAPEWFEGNWKQVDCPLSWLSQA